MSYEIDIVTERAIELFRESAKAIELIKILDETAFGASTIAALLHVSQPTIHNWFDIGKLTNVSPAGKVKTAKFKEFKHLIQTGVK